MYFPFSELRKWGKKTAETRRRNCVVLPYFRAKTFQCSLCSFSLK